MPSICFYVVADDLKLLTSRLCDDPEIAFIVPNGFSRWRRVPRIDNLSSGNQWLWHVLGGPLHHFFRPSSLGEVLTRGPAIETPESGWTSDGLPCEQGTETFQLRIAMATEFEAIALSCLGWVGNRYSVLGKSAKPSTEKWWSRFRRWTEATGIRTSRIGHHASQPPRGLAAYAFPAAHAAITGGRPRSEN